MVVLSDDDLNSSSISLLSEEGVIPKHVIKVLDFANKGLVQYQNNSKKNELLCYARLLDHKVKRAVNWHRLIPDKGWNLHGVVGMMVCWVAGKAQLYANAVKTDIKINVPLSCLVYSDL